MRTTRPIPGPKRADPADRFEYTDPLGQRMKHPADFRGVLSLQGHADRGANGDHADMIPPPFDQDAVLEGDCLALLAAMDEGSVDLIYADPPFATGRKRTGRSEEGGPLGYDDAWPTLDLYLDWLRERIVAMRRVLRDEGAILVHVDWRASHRVRLILDDVFGEDRFVNHIIWSYGLGGSAADRFARKHDDILYYGCGDERWFDPPMVPATSRRMQGRLKKATDVLAIPSINNMATERTGWPDQKPLRLLELLVNATAPPGGVVLDPFCGSGTTVVAARRNGRIGLGMDRHPDAVRIARERLAAEAGSQEAGENGSIGP